MEHLEIEVKFYLSDIDHIRNRIIELGAESIGRAFETNIRFEDADKSLIQKKLCCDSARIKQPPLPLNPNLMSKTINSKY